MCVLCAKCLSICLSVFVLVFLMFLFCVCAFRLLRKYLDHILDIKSHEFLEVPFQCIFNDFGFLLDISSNVMNK